MHLPSLWICNLQQMLQVSSIWFNALMDTSDYGLAHTFRGTGAFASGLTGVQNASVKGLFILNWSWAH